MQTRNVLHNHKYEIQYNRMAKHPQESHFEQEGFYKSTHSIKGVLPVNFAAGERGM
jgi:hypothetical protein